MGASQRVVLLLVVVASVMLTSARRLLLHSQQGVGVVAGHVGLLPVAVLWVGMCRSHMSLCCQHGLSALSECHTLSAAFGVVDQEAKNVAMAVWDLLLLLLRWLLLWGHQHLQVYVHSSLVSMHALLLLCSRAGGSSVLQHHIHGLLCNGRICPVFLAIHVSATFVHVCLTGAVRQHQRSCSGLPPPAVWRRAKRNSKDYSLGLQTRHANHTKPVHPLPQLVSQGPAVPPTADAVQREAVGALDTSAVLAGEEQMMGSW